MITIFAVKRKLNEHTQIHFERKRKVVGHVQFRSNKRKPFKVKMAFESKISDAEVGLSRAGFNVGMDKLWVPEFGWGPYDGKDADKDPFPPQYLAALDIFANLFQTNRIWVHLAAEMQAGKTGVIAALIRLMLNGINYRKIGIPASNIFLITGMNDNDWKHQTRDRMPAALHPNIHHLKGLTNVTVALDRIASRGELKNVLVVLDESHLAAAQYNTPAVQVFEKMKQLTGNSTDSWAEKNIRFVTISATDPASVISIGKDRQVARVVKLQTTDDYQSVETLKAAGRIIDTKPLENREHMHEIFKIVEDRYGRQPLYHILRPKIGYSDEICAAIADAAGYDYIKWDAAENSKKKVKKDDDSSVSSDKPDINDRLRVEPTKPTFIVIKNMFYAAKTLDDTHCGLLYDRASTSHATNLQSLLGRACGYNKSKRTMIYTDIFTVDEYLKTWSQIKIKENGDVVVESNVIDVHRKMPYVNAEELDEGDARLDVDELRANPFTGGARLPEPTEEEKRAKHEKKAFAQALSRAVRVEEFASLDDLNARWKEINGGKAHKLTLQKGPGGLYKCSLGEDSKVHTDVSAVRHWLKVKGAASWGSALTDAKKEGNPTGKKLASVKVAYDGVVPTFFLRWMIYP